MHLRSKLKFLEGKNIIIMDLETTGLPVRKPGYDQYYSYTENSKYESCRIVQIAWCYIPNFSFKKIAKTNIKCYYRKPINFYDMPDEVVAIHGITYETIVENGIKLKNILHGEKD